MKEQSTVTSGGGESLRVVVQARPLLPFEAADGAKAILALSADPPVVTLDSVHGAPTVFDGFDDVYDASIDSEDGSSVQRLYDKHVSPLVESVFEGVNATAFAYGQTCAGKSYTMDRLVSAIAEELFERRDAAIEVGAAVTVRVGFIEIYNERIRDLVDGTNTPLGASALNIQVRERRSNKPGTPASVFLDGAKERVVRDAAALRRIVTEGGVLRQTAATGMNSRSSRSHSVITLSVQVEHVQKATLAAKFHLVDLAGSERAKRTDTRGQRFKEGVQINASLFALAKVISALADNARRGGARKHVPYRDSKLTRLLQDSLGGTARTLLVACVSPASSSREETAGTLRYAARAKAIKNKLRVNVDAHAVEVADLRASLARARAQVAALAAENQALRERLGPARSAEAAAAASASTDTAAQKAMRGRRKRPVQSTQDTRTPLSSVSNNRDGESKRGVRSPILARRRARVNGPASLSLGKTRIEPRNPTAASRLRRRRLRETSQGTDTEMDEKAVESEDEEHVHKSHVERALHVVRTDEMRREFEARSAQLESDKAALEGDKAELQRRLTAAHKAHEASREELRNERSWRAAAASRARLADRQRRCTTSDRAAAASASAARLRRERDEATRAKRLTEGMLADARSARNDMLRKVAMAMARVDAVRKELGRDNRALAKNCAHLKAQLARSDVLRSRQEAVTARVHEENEVLKRKLADASAPLSHPTSRVSSFSTLGS